MNPASTCIVCRSQAFMFFQFSHTSIHSGKKTLYIPGFQHPRLPLSEHECLFLVYGDITIVFFHPGLRRALDLWKLSTCTRRCNLRISRIREMQLPSSRQRCKTWSKDPKTWNYIIMTYFFWAVHQSRRGNINKGRKVNRSNTTISGYSHLRAHFISTSIALHCYFLSVISNRISYSVLDSLNHDQSYSFTAL